MLNYDIGYEGGLKSDLGVRDYQKVENPWFSSLTIAIRILFIAMSETRIF